MGETTRTMDVPEFSYGNYKGWAIRYAADEDGARLWALCDILKAMRITSPTLAQRRIPDTEKVLAFRQTGGEPCGTGMWLVTDGGFAYLLETSRMPEKRDMTIWLDAIIGGRQENGNLPSCESPDAEISVAEYGDGCIRMFTKNDEPWFILKDLCDILDIANSRNVTARLDEDEVSDVRLIDINSNGIRQSRTYTAVNESGMYAAVMNSSKPEAKEFQRWLRKEVLPTLRRTGEYRVRDKRVLMLCGMNPDVRLEDALKRLEDYNVSHPAEYMDAGEFASVATDGKLGRTAFFRWMRDRGYFVRRDGINLLCGNWAMTDWFRVVWYTDWNTGMRSPSIKITVAGQKGLVRHMAEDGIL